MTNITKKSNTLREAIATATLIVSDPATIVAAIERVLAPDDLGGLHVLITAGGTREAIDPVRFIGNRSSGKQGHALAEDAVARGAKVTLVTSAAQPIPAGVEAIPVVTAAEMEEAVLLHSDSADVIVMAAAVADFRPVAAAPSKIKKQGGVPAIELEPTPDILAGLGARKRPDQVLVGFAAETDDVEAHAADKLSRKGLDLIVANDVSAAGVGFEHDTNAVTLLDADGLRREVTLTSKRAVAAAILDVVAERLGRS